MNKAVGEEEEHGSAGDCQRAPPLMIFGLQSFARLLKVLHVVQMVKRGGIEEMASLLLLVANEEAERLQKAGGEEASLQPEAGGDNAEGTGTLEEGMHAITCFPASCSHY